MEYIILDKGNVLQDRASIKGNLSRGLTAESARVMRLRLPAGIKIGDEFDPETLVVTPRSENYPPPTEENRKEAKIEAKKREMAIAALKAEGDPDFRGAQTQQGG